MTYNDKSMKFIRLLKEYGVYNRFIDTFCRYHLNDKSDSINRLLSNKWEPDQYLLLAFSWSETKDGDRFWDYVWSELKFNDII